MGERSRLCHTAVDNGFAPLFEPRQRETTRRVLAGEAGPEESSEARERIARWPTVRRAVEANLRAFEVKYTPFVKAHDMLRDRMAPEEFANLGACHRERMRSLHQVNEFVSVVRSTMSAFEDGLRAVGDGKMTVDELGRIHAEMVDAYRMS